MNVTPRQREEWERKRKVSQDYIDKKLQVLESAIENLIKERDRIESMTIEDSYFEYLAEQGSER